MKIDIALLGDEDYEDELMDNDGFVKLKKKKVNRRKDDDIHKARRMRQEERDKQEWQQRKENM